MSDHSNDAYAEGKIYAADMGDTAGGLLVANLIFGGLIFAACVFALIVYFRWEREEMVSKVVLTVESQEIPQLRKKEAGWLQATEKPKSGSAIDITKAMKLTVQELGAKK